MRSAELTLSTDAIRHILVLVMAMDGRLSVSATTDHRAGSPSSFFLLGMDGARAVTYHFISEPRTPHRPSETCRLL